MEIIVGHYGTDFDCLAAMVGLKRLYPKSVCVFPLHLDRNVKDFLALYEDAFHFGPEWSVDPDEVSRLIMADTQRSSRLGPFASLVEKPGIEVHIWDHHPTTGADVRAHQAFVEPLGATTTLVVRELRRRGAEIDGDEATLFALGIYEDTGSLTFSATTVEDVQAVAFLLERGAKLDVVARFLRYTLTEEQRAVLNQFLLSVRHHLVHGIPLAIAHARVADYVGDVAVLTHKLALIESVEVIFTVTQTRKSIYLVGRSRTDAVDVAAVLGRFGGGGHHRAASAVIKDMAPPEVEKALLEAAQAAIQPPLRAKDIMSYPVRSVEGYTTVDEAQKMLQRYGYSGAVVVEEGRMVGIISRKDIDKAKASGLGHAPVKGCMSRNVVVTHPEAPLPDVEQLFLIHNVGRVPVMDGDRLAGIISRSDLRRGIHPRAVEPLRFAWKGYDDLSSLMEERLAPAVLDLLKQAGRLAEERGNVVFLVGGAVRDIFLGKENFDIDLLVEGDGIGFAQALAESQGGQATGVHERFGTASIQLPGGLRVDLATARTEFYDRPAALPSVEYSSVRDDLLRRDFTINAMAIQLNPDHFGRLLDFFGGREDLENGAIRVLHNLSFFDDPTRIFRAVRFEQRLGFAIDSQTLSLLQYALESQVLGQLTDTRIRDEIVLLLSEPNPIPPLHRLAHLGVLEHIHEKLAFDQSVLDQLARVREVLQWYRQQAIRRGGQQAGEGEPVDQWILYLLPLVQGMTPTEAGSPAGKWRAPARTPMGPSWRGSAHWPGGLPLRDLAWRLRLPQSAVGVLAAVEQAENYTLPALSAGEISPSQVYNLMWGLPLQAILWMLARTSPSPSLSAGSPSATQPALSARGEAGTGTMDEEALSGEVMCRAREHVVRFLLEYRNFRLQVTGDELRQLGYRPGPGYGRVLRQLLGERLDGLVGPEDESRRLAELAEEILK